MSVGTGARVPAEVRSDLPAHTREIRRTRAARPPGPRTWRCWTGCWQTRGCRHRSSRPGRSPAAGPAGRRRPPPSGLIPLPCNEVHTCSRSRSPDRSAIPASGCAGRSGDADIKPAPYLPRPTTGRLADREDHDLRLEYQPQHFMVAPCLRSGAGQWRRDPVTAPRALATLTRMARDDCAGEERKGEEWAVGLSRIVAGAAGYPLVSRPGVSSPGSRRPVTWPGAGLGVRGSDGGRNGPGTPGI